MGKQCRYIGLRIATLMSPLTATTGIQDGESGHWENMHLAQLEMSDVAVLQININKCEDEAA